jgi:hypothetical protein
MLMVSLIKVYIIYKQPLIVASGWSSSQVVVL